MAEHDRRRSGCVWPLRSRGIGEGAADLRLRTSGLRERALRGERIGEFRHDCQIDVQRHALDAPHPQGSDRLFGLEPAELPLDGPM
jgi:hypothetical protein